MSHKFDNAEDAFFWAFAVQKERNAGAVQRSGNARHPKNFYYTDVLGIIDRLFHEKKITFNHALVMQRFGAAGELPDDEPIMGYGGKKVNPRQLWDEVMTLANERLIQKDILFADAKHSAAQKRHCAA